MKKSDASVVAVTSSHGVMHAYLVILPALIPLMVDELGNLTLLAYIASLVTFFYGWGSLPVGFLADNISKKMLIMISMIICGLASIIVGLSGNINFTALGMILIGIGASFYHSPGYGHMALLSLEMRGRYMGIQGLGGDLGMAVAYITSAALGINLGWRMTFVLWGIVGILMAIIDFYIVEDIKTSLEEKSIPKGGIFSTIRSMFSTEHRTNLLLVLLVVMLSGGLWSGVSQWILTYINQTKNISLLIAGGLSTIQYTVGAFAQLIGGELSDKIGRKIILILGFIFYAVSLIALVLAPGNFLILLTLVILLGFTFYVTQAPLSALLGDIAPKNTVGIAYGINFTVKYGFGSILPFMATWISANYGLDYVFYFFAILSILALIITLPIKEEKKLNKI